MALFYSPLARQDIDEIYHYISTTLSNPSSAAETVGAILDEAESLEDFPQIGTIVNGLPVWADEYRFLPVRNYLIFYRVAEDGVFVDRILYKRRDYQSLLALQQ